MNPSHKEETKMSKRFVIDIKTYPAPNSGRGKYRRPVVVRIYDTKADGNKWHWARGMNSGRLHQWSNLDSRYKGAKSEYGVVIAHAKKLVEKYNEQEMLDL